jgi:branched-chain amino acid aminotransferase
VAEIDGKQIGEGKAGPMTLRIRALYKELVARNVAAQT